MKILQYDCCSQCNGLFEDRTHLLSHQDNCSGSFVKSPAHIFAIDRDLLLAFEPLRDALNRYSSLLVMKAACKQPVLPETHQNLCGNDDQRFVQRGGKPRKTCTHVETNRKVKHSLISHQVDDSNFDDENKCNDKDYVFVTKDGSSEKSSVTRLHCEAGSASLQLRSSFCSPVSTRSSLSIVETPNLVTRDRRVTRQCERAKYDADCVKSSPPHCNIQTADASVLTHNVVSVKDETNSETCETGADRRKEDSHSSDTDITPIYLPTRHEVTGASTCVGKKRASSAGGRYCGQKKLYAAQHKLWAEKYRDNLVIRDDVVDGHCAEDRMKKSGESNTTEYACKLCSFRSTQLGFFDRHMRKHLSALQSISNFSSPVSTSTGSLSAVEAPNRVTHDHRLTRQCKRTKYDANCVKSSPRHCNIQKSDASVLTHNIVSVKDETNSETCETGADTRKEDSHSSDTDITPIELPTRREVTGASTCVGKKRASSAGGRYCGQKKSYAAQHKLWAEKYRDNLVIRDDVVDGHCAEDRMKKSGKSNATEYACKLCSFRSTQLGFFDRHMRKHQSEVVFTCDICSFRCMSRGKLNKHTHVHTRPFMCEFCSTCFAEKRDLQRHVWIHTEYLPFSCTKCEYKCRYKRVLEEHQRKHTGLMLSCPEKECSFRTCYKVALDNHRVAKHELSMYQCDKCSYVSYDRYKYYRHVKLHNQGSLKTYSCTSCTYNTEVKHNFMKHVRRHTQEKVYFCNLCTYSSAYSQSLRLHLLHHYGFKPWKCSVCQHQTFTKQKMERHMAAKHPNCECKPLNIATKLDYNAGSFRRSISPGDHLRTSLDERRETDHHALPPATTDNKLVLESVS